MSENKQGKQGKTKQNLNKGMCMKRKRAFLITASMILLIAVGCNKNRVTDPAQEEPKITTATTTPPTIIALTSQGIMFKPTQALIVWGTNVPCTAQVSYGTTTSYGLQTTELPINLNNITNTYTVVLTGLQPDTQYHFIVKGTNAQGQSVVSQDRVFTTSTSEATLAQIYNVKVSDIHANDITITFNTDKSVTAAVIYGKDLSNSGGDYYGRDTATTNHKISLTQLNSNTKYYFYIEADYPNNTSTSPWYTFTIPAK